MGDTVTPTSATIEPGKKQIFSVAATWIVEPPGIGSMDGASGLYQAPAAISADQDLNVIAKDADGREIGRSSLKLVAGAQTSLTAAPESVVVPAIVALTAGQSQQFSLRIAWTLEPADAPGVVDPQSGQFEAPCDVRISRSLCVVATSHSGKRLGRAHVTVVPSPPPVRSLKITPEMVELAENQQEAFLVDPGDPGVVWETPARGEITQTGVYTSPAKITLSQTIVLTAKSVDGAQYGHATIKLSDARRWIRVLGWFWVVAIAVMGWLVLNVWPKTVASTEEMAVVVSPPAITLNVTREKTQTFTSEVLGVTDDGKKAVTWSRSTSGSGSVSQSSGVYVTEDEAVGQVLVTATSKADPSRSSTAVVYRTKDTSLAVSPPSSTVNTSKGVEFTATWQSTPSPPPAGPGGASAQSQQAPPANPAGATPQTTATTPPTKSTTTSVTGGAAQGAVKPTITWSISPNLGKVFPQGADGLKVKYEAPNSIDRTQVVTITATGENERGTAAASIILTGPPKSSVSLHLLLLAILMGSLGSALHAVLSLTAYVGSQKFVATWVWWYVFRPFVGGALALFFYFLLALGKVGGATLDPSWVALLCGMAGLFADKATSKLSEIFDALIGPKNDPRTDKLDGGTSNPTAKGPLPTVTALSPAEVKVGETPALTLTGTNFRDGATAQVKGVSHPAAKITPTSLEVRLTKEDTASPGDVEVVVVNSDGTRSAAKTFLVKP